MLARECPAMAVAVWTAQPRFSISVIPECRRMWTR
jgi:hypothetical protein